MTESSDTIVSRFPADFRFGVATSAYQIEGALTDDGRGRSIWESFAEQPGAIERGETAAVACAHYHRYRDDVALLGQLGVQSYRFSIAWPRVQPEGSGAVNAKGLAFYDRLVDELLRAGIRPFPTLYHWDLPQALEDTGGWSARDTAERFADYAQVVTRAMGDRVGEWSLFNEPYIFTSRGYLLGRYAPGRRSLRGFLRAVHVVNRAHALGYRAIKAVNPDLHVGTVYAMAPVEPATQSAGDMEAMRTPLDFVGVNCYYRLIISAGANVRSYHAWSLYDNFEWASGYRPRFGMVHVDYATQQRTFKDSATWYRALCHAARARQYQGV